MSVVNAAVPEFLNASAALAMIEEIGQLEPAVADRLAEWGRAYRFNKTLARIEGR